MALPIWNEPNRIVPSPAYFGETDKDTLHLAVGRALNEWENVEQILAWIFRHLVESRSAAATSVYGRLIAGTVRREALETATWDFFRHKGGDPVMLDYVELFSAYGNTSQYRNNIAHGICYATISTGGQSAFHSGWFLYPPQYNMRRRLNATNAGAFYIYKATDIDHCRLRFTQLAAEASDLEGYLRVNYPLR